MKQKGNNWGGVRGREKGEQEWEIRKSDRGNGYDQITLYACMEVSQ
jgi:hypothetical protein